MKDRVILPVGSSQCTLSPTRVGTFAPEEVHSTMVSTRCCPSDTVFSGSKMVPHSPYADALERCLDPSMTEWERSREREEFARAAQLYVSSHSTLSSRFTHAKEEDDSDQVEVPRDQEVCRHLVPTW